MKATEFVKKFGLQAAQYWIGRFETLNEVEEKFINIGFRDDLKQIVEARELVESYGGLAEAKWDLDNPKIDASEAHDLKQAINLVEQCNA